MHHMFLRHGLRSFSAKRRRTVSREMLSCSVGLTSSFANSSRVQRARPSGGFEQAVATSKAAKSRATLIPPLKSPSALISLRKIGIGKSSFASNRDPTQEVDSHK